MGKLMALIAALLWALDSRAFSHNRVEPFVWLFFMS
jgi:hypothetical protein